MPDKEKSCNHAGLLVGELCIDCFTKELKDQIKAQAAVIESAEKALQAVYIPIEDEPGVKNPISQGIEEALSSIRALKEKYGG